MVPFKPSQINLNGSYPPLCATMGKAEGEYAAALIVLVLRDSGDEWRPVTFREVSDAVKREFEANRDPFFSLAMTPFLKPNAHVLVEKGLARWVDGEPGKAPIELTPEGIERLRRWVSVGDSAEARV